MWAKYELKRLVTPRVVPSLVHLLLNNLNIFIIKKTITDLYCPNCLHCLVSLNSNSIFRYSNPIEVVNF
jgi:hypothetical protein